MPNLNDREGWKNGYRRTDKEDKRRGSWKSYVKNKKEEGECALNVSSGTMTVWQRIMNVKKEICQRLTGSFVDWWLSDWGCMR